MKIYELRSDSTNYSHFFQDYCDGEESIIGKAMKKKWSSFGGEYNEVVLELASDDFGRKNYKFDFSGFLRPFFVISSDMLEKMEEMLQCRGEILPVITKSKKKKFFGYYPTNVLSECFDKKKSKYREYPNGLMIEKIVLLKEKVKEDYLFTIIEDISRVFVTNKFKEKVEEYELKGFDFTREVELN